MAFFDDAAGELVRLLLGLAFVAALVWICGRMPRAYVALKVLALASWGVLSVAIPAFVFFAAYLPSRQFALGAVALAVGAACMIWPFVVFGWPALRNSLRAGAAHRP
ncbi:hypothetical protein [Trinickia soli]|uniref:Uncharacterized protein n=1 Tax=Trinickia soli TaxID=380675 RepID=A0A2N7VQ72_9BURK|nr:hypothetical protein [Trinickia soli]PMS19277.1 hypothetical protein C0Z19_21845 [Trinickia soli]CAB3644241.1 hypothetical protein LMG24076_00473 [Trinickia soli]